MQAYIDATKETFEFFLPFGILAVFSNSFNRMIYAVVLFTPAGAHSQNQEV